MGQGQSTTRRGGNVSYSDTFESESFEAHKSTIPPDKTTENHEDLKKKETLQRLNMPVESRRRNHFSSWNKSKSLKMPSIGRTTARRKLMQNVDAKLTVWRENRLTDVDEGKSDKSLRYRVPKFRAMANVTFPAISTRETWQVGWVQACFFIKFINQYGHYGYTSWEFPQLTRGQICVNDSDGNLFPWYSYKRGMREIIGPTKMETNFEVVMNDSPSSQLSLSVPSSQYQARKCLTAINRSQRFKVWLVARNVDSEQVFPIKCISWELTAHIGVSPSSEQGRRTTVLDPPQKPPVIHKSPHEIPLPALMYPECNKAQALIWRPSDPRKKVSVIVPPSWAGSPPLTNRDLENPFLLEEERLRKEMIARWRDMGNAAIYN